MNVLISQKIAGFSGSEYYLSKLIPHLRNRGINVYFLAITTQAVDEKNLELYSLFDEHRITYFKYYLRCSLDLGLLFFLKKIVKKNNIEIIHSHLIHADFWFATYKFLLNPKIVYVSTKHGYQEHHLLTKGFSDKINKWSVYRNVALLAERFTNASFVISKGLYSLYTGAGICNPNKTSVIQYGFDFDEVEELEDLRFSKNQLILVGRLVAYKGHRYALRAVEKLIAKYPDLMLIIVGDGADRTLLEGIVKKKNLQKNVLFLGYRNDILELIKSSDVMLITSIAEGFGIVILEGFASQTPIVAFDVPAPNELIQSGETGFLAKPFSIDDLVEKVDILLSDHTKRKLIADNAKDQLEKYFNLDRMVIETIDFYHNTFR